MIRTFGSAATERFAASGRSRFSGIDEAKARLRLDQLDAAVTPRSVDVLNSVGLHMLKGDRACCWAVTINGPGDRSSGLPTTRHTTSRSWTIIEVGKPTTFGQFHPGVTLRDELEARGMSGAGLALKLRVPPTVA